MIFAESNSVITMGQPNYPDAARETVLNWVPLESRKILDVGCNYGRFGEALKIRQVAEVWGIEPNVQAADVAATRLDRVIAKKFRPGLDLPTASFDLITFNDSLEHMPDPNEALALAFSLLKPGGMLLCTVPNVRHIDTVEQLILEGEWRYETYGVRDNTHLRFFTLKSLERTVRQAGFIVQRTSFIMESWWVQKKLFRRVLFRLAPKLTHEFRYVQIMTMAERPRLD